MKKIFALVIAITSVAITSYSQNSWTQKANFGGFPRNRAAGFSIGNKGYIGTGYNGAYHNDFWEYDPGTDSWAQKANVGGDERGYAVAFSLGEKGYMGLGYNPSVGYKTDLWEYDPVANSWLQKASFPAVGRAGSLSFALDGSGYLGGGYSSSIGFLKEFWQYNPTTDTWTQKADFGGSPRTTPAALSIGQFGYMGLGYDGATYPVDFWQYDPSTDDWAQIADFAGIGRTTPVGFSLGNKGYVGTGWNSITENFYNDLWKYDPDSDSWTQKADFGGAARQYATGIAIGDHGYFGAGNDAFYFYSDFWEYSDCVNGSLVYADNDADGFGDALNPLFVNDCVAPAGYVNDSTDCNDANALVHPGAPEILGDGIDNNCNGIIDEQDTLVMTDLFWVYSNDEEDGWQQPVFNDSAWLPALNIGLTCNPLCFIGGDHYGDISDLPYTAYLRREFIVGNQPWHAVMFTSEDDDVEIYINGTLVFTDDNHYAGSYYDIDVAPYLIANDTNVIAVKHTDWYCCGYGFSLLINIPTCNGLNGFADSDGDGFGDANSSYFAADCILPSDYVPDSTDCDDADATVHALGNFYADSDGDSYGAGLLQSICYSGVGTPTGYSINNTDCDDNNPAINPSEEEICNSIDDDCDGLIDNFTISITASASPESTCIGNSSTLTAGIVTGASEYEFSTLSGVALEDMSSGTTLLIGSGNDDVASSATNLGFTFKMNGVDFTKFTASSNGLLILGEFGSSQYSNSFAGIPYFPAILPLWDDLHTGNNGRVIYKVIGSPGTHELIVQWQVLNYSEYGDYYGSNFTKTFQAWLFEATGVIQFVYGSGTDLSAASIGIATSYSSFNSVNTTTNTANTSVADDYNYDWPGAGTSYLFTPPVDINVVFTWSPDNGTLSSTAGATVTATTSVTQTYTVTASIGSCIAATATATVNVFPYSTYYADNDFDGYGNPADSIVDCIAPSGYVIDNTDCDDSDSEINPGADETCNGIDDNCNGLSDDGIAFHIFYQDADGDGYGNHLVDTLACKIIQGYVLNWKDCDDTNPDIHHNADEVCNGVDDDCDNLIDEDLSLITYYADADGDGFGDANNPMIDCTPPQGFVSDSTDCDDNNAAINPSASEICNNIDDDCNGTIDDGALVTFYADNDGDSYGDANNTTLACTLPYGYVIDNTDCDDNNAAINPSVTETCNNIDDNCDGSIDEGLLQTFYADMDGDNFGDNSNSTLACTQPDGYVTNNTDCDDNNSAINPSSAEICNSVDDNCNGSIDDGVLITFFADNDGDNYGDANNTTLACTLPNGYVTNNTDCDDNNSDINPSATEICNSLDDNCNGTADDGLTFITYYADADGDNYGDANNSTNACAPVSGYVTDNTDCDDNNSAINPSAIEICNSVDDNCNGTADDGLTFVIYYADADGDTYGDPNNSVSACETVNGYILDNTDCDDNNSNVNPGAPEISNNGIDDDCDGYVDEFGVGISELGETTPTFSVFPNPTDGAFTLLLNFPGKENTEAKIEVLNLIGQIIISDNGEIQNGELRKELQLSDAAAEGMYLLKVTINDQVFNSQINYQK